MKKIILVLVMAVSTLFVSAQSYDIYGWKMAGLETIQSGGNIYVAKNHFAIISTDAFSTITFDPAPGAEVEHDVTDSDQGSIEFETIKGTFTVWGHEYEGVFFKYLGDVPGFIVKTKEFTFYYYCKPYEEE